MFDHDFDASYPSPGKESGKHFITKGGQQFYEKKIIIGI